MKIQSVYRSLLPVAFAPKPILRASTRRSGKPDLRQAKIEKFFADPDRANLSTLEDVVSYFLKGSLTPNSLQRSQISQANMEIIACEASAFLRTFAWFLQRAEKIIQTFRLMEKDERTLRASVSILAIMAKAVWLRKWKDKNYQIPTLPADYQQRLGVVAEIVDAGKKTSLQELLSIVILTFYPPSNEQRRIEAKPSVSAPAPQPCERSTDYSPASLEKIKTSAALMDHVLGLPAPDDQALEYFAIHMLGNPSNMLSSLSQSARRKAKPDESDLRDWQNALACIPLRALQEMARRIQSGGTLPNSVMGILKSRLIRFLNASMESKIAEFGIFSFAEFFWSDAWVKREMAPLNVQQKDVLQTLVGEVTQGGFYNESAENGWHHEAFGLRKTLAVVLFGEYQRCLPYINVPDDYPQDALVRRGQWEPLCNYLATLPELDRHDIVQMYDSDSDISKREIRQMIGFSTREDLKNALDAELLHDVVDKHRERELEAHHRDVVTHDLTGVDPSQNTKKDKMKKDGSAADPSGDSLAP